MAFECWNSWLLWPRRAGFCLFLLLLGLLLSPSPADASLSDKLTISGWAGAMFSGDLVDGSSPSLDAHPWYLNLLAEPIDGYRVFGEIEAEHSFKLKGDSGSGELKLERLYLERRFSRAHHLRVGKFFMPLGHWYRSHWHFLTETCSRPISFNNAYAPRSQVGFQYWGSATAGGVELDYYAWLTDGPVEFGTNKRELLEPGFGAALFARYALEESPDINFGVSLGFHGQWVPVTNTAGVVSAAAQRNEQIGLEARLRYVDLRVEAYFHQHDDKAKDLFSWYANLTGWVLPELGINYRYDRGDDLKRAGEGTGSAYADSHSVGLVWRPNNWALLKGELRSNHFAAADVDDFAEFSIMAAIRY